MVPLRRNKALYAAALAFIAAGLFLLAKLRSVREASRSGRGAVEESLIRH